jgi:hypothetical protein
MFQISLFNSIVISKKNPLFIQTLDSIFPSKTIHFENFIFDFWLELYLISVANGNYKTVFFNLKFENIVIDINEG